MLAVALFFGGDGGGMMAADVGETVDGRYRL